MTVEVDFRMRQLQLFEPPPRAETAHPEPPRVSTPPREVTPRAGKAELRRRLDELLSGDVASLTLTDNRSRIVSARQGPRGLEVRIHRSFLDAPPATLKEVAGLLDGVRGARRRRALAVIREHFEEHGQPPRAAPRRRRTLETRGRHFDLRHIRDDLNRRFFGSRLEIGITWGRTPMARRRRRRGRGFSLRLGSYHADEGLVRVHRALDRPDVPLCVVEAVVYHEMLHAVVPPVKAPGGRRQIHPPEFQRREREYPRYEEAERWLAANLARLAGVE